MNLSDPRHPWSRLTAAARRVPANFAVAAPYGFATRVVARALAQPSPISSLFERFALRAVSVACLVAILSVAVNYPVLTGAAAQVVVIEEYGVPADDAVAVVLDLTD